MISEDDLCSPGSHPHSDRPNWHPGETLEHFLQNVREGLEQPSDRRLAKLMGVPRVMLWRMRMMAEIPEDLFERLLDGGILSTKALAQMGYALRNGENSIAETERCPHCGHVLRKRPQVSSKAVAIVNAWLAEQPKG
jgi:hypothetical protein